MITRTLKILKLFFLELLTFGPFIRAKIILELEARP